MIYKKGLQGIGIGLLLSVLVSICMIYSIQAQNPTETVCIIPIDGPYLPRPLFTHNPVDPSDPKLILRSGGLARKVQEGDYRCVFELIKFYLSVY